MLRITRRLLAGTTLVALPATFLMGCGGGGGGGNTLPTSTPLPTSVPTVTPIPTAPTLTISANFSNIRGTNIPALFQSNSGTGSFLNDPAVVYYANFKRTGNETRELGLTINGEAKAVEGTTLQFVNGRDVFQAARLLTYVDPANGKSFTTRSGTIRFLKITPVTGPGGQSLTKVSFSLSNVVMVPQNGIETNETFTVNGIGETTLAPPVT